LNWQTTANFPSMMPEPGAWPRWKEFGDAGLFGTALHPQFGRGSGGSFASCGPCTPCAPGAPCGACAPHRPLVPCAPCGSHAPFTHGAPFPTFAAFPPHGLSWLQPGLCGAQARQLERRWCQTLPRAASCEPARHSLPPQNTFAQRNAHPQRLRSTPAARRLGVTISAPVSRMAVFQPDAHHALKQVLPEGSGQEARLDESEGLIPSTGMKVPARSEVTAALDLLSACSLKPPGARHDSRMTAVSSNQWPIDAEHSRKSELQLDGGGPAQPVNGATPAPSPKSRHSSPKLSPQSAACGSFVLRRAAPNRASQGSLYPNSHRVPGQCQAPVLRQRSSRPQQHQEELRKLQNNSDGNAAAQNVAEAVLPVRDGDAGFSPLPFSPFVHFPSHGPQSPPGSDGCEAALQDAAKNDTGTQTVLSTPQRREPGCKAAASRETACLWSKSRSLSACISALAIKDDSEDGQQTHRLRKLEVRVASCWRSEGCESASLKGSEHSSLQLSSTQSPSSSARDNHSCDSVADRGLQQTPISSLSSVSSPLDNLSLLKDLENISPSRGMMSEDVGGLHVKELQRRAEALSQKLQHRERQCMVLREALENCNHHFRHALEPVNGNNVLAVESARC